MSPPELLSQGAYARRRGVSQQYISQCVRSGKVPTIGGKIDPEQADRALARESGDPGMAFVRAANARKRKPKASASSDPARPPTNGNGSGGAASPEGAGIDDSWAAERRRMARADADLREMERDRRRGLLCEVARVRFAATDIGAAIRRTLKQLPDRIGTRIAAESGINIRQCVMLLDSEIERALEQAGDALASLPDEATRGQR